MTAKDILRDLVAIDTIKDRCNKEIMDYIENFLCGKGLTVERYLNWETGKEVLTASTEKEPAVCFIGHTDTVSVTEGWNTDPFALTEKDGFLYGLGACDMKGGIAAALATLENIDISQLTKGIQFIWTYDEEIMFNGIKDILNLGIKMPDNVIICEPTNLIPRVGSKGLLEYIITFRGVTTHSSAPIDGKNSNKNAVSFLKDMMDFEEKLRDQKYELFDVPYTTMNIGIIEGGEAINKVPDKTVVYMDFRISDSLAQHRLIKETVEDRLSQYDASFEIINDVESFANNGSLVDFFEKITGEKGRAFVGLSEASFVAGDRVVMGPGPVTAHEANERISAESLEKTEKIYREVIIHLCR